MSSRQKTRARRMAYGLPLLGAAMITVLVAIVVIAFGANSGLPLASTYDVTAQLPTAQRLVANDAVRIGGIRVGRVGRVEVLTRADGPVARIGLSLDDDAGPLPVDTRVRVRQASVLGASYVELKPGTARRTIADGGALLPESGTSVQLTDLLDVFDRETAANITAATRETSSGLAGRGTAVNATLRSLAPALTGLAHVARALAAPDTQLEGLLVGYERFITELAGARVELAGLVSRGGVTFEALAAEGRDLARVFEVAPAAQRSVTSNFARLRPSLRSLATSATTLRASTRLLAPALRAADGALRAGMTPVGQLPRTARRLRPALRQLRILGGQPSARGSLQRGADTFRALGTTLEVLTPAQVQCNAISLWGENFSNGFGSLGFQDGPSAASVFLTHLGAENEMFQNAAPSRNVAINNRPHANYDECETGNEPYTGRRIVDNPPGLQSNRTRPTRPPRGSLERAKAAGLIGPDEVLP